jgi:hypothetical protein
MLMRTANAMKLVGMPLPDGVEEEMEAAFEGAGGEEDQRDAASEVLRSYSFTDAEFLSETQSMMEEHIVRDVGKVQGGENEVPPTPPVLSLPSSVVTSGKASVASKEGPTPVLAGGGEFGEEEEEGEDPDSPEQRVLRAAKGYKASLFKCF